jgi:serine/threonine protein kinase
VTIYELLHGHRPWKDWTQLQQQAQLLQQQNNNENKTNLNNPTASRRSSNNSPAGLGAAGGSTNNLLNKAAEEDAAVVAVSASYTESSAGEVTAMKSFHISSRLDSAVHDFLRSILSLDIKQRLTNWTAVKSHPFFNGIDWRAMNKRQSSPPVKPDLTKANCTADADLADQLLDRKPRQITAEQQENFQGWDYKTQIKESAEPNNKNQTPNNSSNNNHNNKTTVKSSGSVENAIKVTVAASNNATAAATATASNNNTTNTINS